MATKQFSCHAPGPALVFQRLTLKGVAKSGATWPAAAAGPVRLGAVRWRDFGQAHWEVSFSA
jgi:hypothetical protein